MGSKILWKLIAMLVITAMILAACGPEKVGGFEIPDVEKGKFNVAMGSHWTT